MRNDDRQPDRLSQALHEEGLAQGPEFSPALHQRTITAGRTARLQAQSDARRGRATSRGYLWPAGALAAAAAVVLGFTLWNNPSVVQGPRVVRVTPPPVPEIPDPSELLRAGTEPFRQAMVSFPTPDLDGFKQDAKGAADYLMRQLPFSSPRPQEPPPERQL